MLRIYDESQYRNHTRLKRLQVLALFVGGTLSGAWLTGAGGQWPLLADALAAHGEVQRPATRFKTIRTGTLHSCLSNAGAGLRLDCQLSVPELPRAEGV